MPMTSVFSIIFEPLAATIVFNCPFNEAFNRFPLYSCPSPSPSTFPLTPLSRFGKYSNCILAATIVSTAENYDSSDWMTKSNNFIWHVLNRITTKDKTRFFPSVSPSRTLISSPSWKRYRNKFATIILIVFRTDLLDLIKCWMAFCSFHVLPSLLLLLFLHLHLPHQPTDPSSLQSPPRIYWFLRWKGFWVQLNLSQIFHVSRFDFLYFFL